jgi:hypothetical protein
MIIITTALCLFCGWLGYELGKADGHTQGFIEGCSERREHSLSQCREMTKEEIGKFKQ